MSDSLQLYGLQQARLPSPSLSPRVCSDLCPLSQWCYLAIISSDTFFSFCLQFFPKSGFFPVSSLFASGGQSTGASASASVLLISRVDFFRTDWFDLLCAQGTLKSLLSSVQSLSRVWLFATLWTAAYQASLSITNSRSLLKLMSIESGMQPNHLILCCPLLLLPQSFPASGSFQMSQLFTSGSQVLEFQLQQQSFQWTPRTDLL